jgi:hypothetical protein
MAEILDHRHHAEADQRVVIDGEDAEALQAIEVFGTIRHRRAFSRDGIVFETAVEPASAGRSRAAGRIDTTKAPPALRQGPLAVPLLDQAELPQAIRHLRLHHTGSAPLEMEQVALLDLAEIGRLYIKSRKVLIHDLSSSVAGSTNRPLLLMKA